MNQEIIKLALEGGYEPSPDFNMVYPNKHFICDDGSIAYTELDGKKLGIVDITEILLDKEFWIALGKSLGWPEKNKLGNESCYNWRGHALEFLDARFEGREQEFFKELIEKR